MHLIEIMFFCFYDKAKQKLSSILAIYVLICLTNVIKCFWLDMRVKNNKIIEIDPIEIIMINLQSVKVLYIYMI